MYIYFLVQGLFSLMGSFSVGDDGNDGQVAPTKATVPPTPAHKTTKPIANETSAVTEPAPAAAVASSTTTKATVEIIASTTAATKTATEPISTEATTTRVTASTMVTTTSPPATSTGAPWEDILQTNLRIGYCPSLFAWNQLSWSI